MKISMILILSLMLVMLSLAAASHHGKKGHHQGGKRHHVHRSQSKKGLKGITKPRSRRETAEVNHAVVKKEDPAQSRVDDFVLDERPNESNNEVLDTAATFWPFTDWNSYFYEHPRVYNYGRPYYSGGFGTRRRGWWPAGYANRG